MANNYNIIFKPLRSGVTYTLAIGGGTGAPSQLNGAASPVVTQEFDDDDEFAPIRTQSGYIRIVDNGRYYDGTAGFSWKDLLPVTDTSRPVTLTRTLGQSSEVVWQGFMQAQNFSGRLYGNPQVRELPIQCPLTILEGEDINYQQTFVQNFAYLLQRVVNTIDVKSGGVETAGVITTPGMVHIDTIYIQGGSDAQQWLLKKIDWQNFVSEDADGNLVARYNMYQCLEDMCRFWGWTARTNRRDLYLTCADDQAEQSWLTLNRAQLDTMAAGTAAGDTAGSFTVMDIDGGDYGSNVFANVEQDETLLRGANKATVTSDIGAYSKPIIEAFPTSVSSPLIDGGFIGDSYVGHEYTTELNTFQTGLMAGTAASGAAFCVEHIMPVGARTSDEILDVIRMKSQYDADTVLATLESEYHHCFADGLLSMSGNVYINGEQLSEPDEVYSEVGGKKLYMCLGVGLTLATAKWWNGKQWTATKHKFIARVGNSNGEMWSENISEVVSGQALLRSIPTTSNYGGSQTSAGYGKIFVQFYGTDDIEYNSTDKTLDLADFSLTFERTNEDAIILDIERKIATRNDVCVYQSSNQNNVRNEFNADVIYGSENRSRFGFGVVLDSYASYFKGYVYAGDILPTRPEQHLADRVTAYWQQSRRRLALSLRTELVTDITPKNLILMDGTTAHPIAISHDWRDDVTRVTLLEMPTNE